MPASYNVSPTSPTGINFGVFTGLDEATAASVTCWLKFDTERNDVLFGSQHDNFSAATWYFSWETYFTFTCKEKNTGVNYSSARSTATAASLVTTDTWYMFGFTWTQPGTFQAYMNGAALATTVINSAASKIGTSGIDYELGVGSTGAFMMDGNIAMFQLYDRVLSASEMAELYYKQDAIIDSRKSFIPVRGSTPMDLETGATGTISANTTASFDGPPIYLP